MSTDGLPDTLFNMLVLMANGNSPANPNKDAICNAELVFIDEAHSIKEPLRYVRRIFHNEYNGDKSGQID